MSKGAIIMLSLDKTLEAFDAIMHHCQGGK